VCVTIQRILQRLLEALQIMTGGMPTRGFAPVMDGRSLPRHPFTPDAPAIAANVPVMVGYTKDETTVLFPTPDLFTLDWTGLKQKLTPQLQSMNVDAVIAGMRKLRPNATPTDLYFTITTEPTLDEGSYILASRATATRTKRTCHCGQRTTTNARRRWCSAWKVLRKMIRSAMDSQRCCGDA
jgi:carboxylesterase type B